MLITQMPYIALQAISKMRRRKDLTVILTDFFQPAGSAPKSEMFLLGAL
jgi:hypothetical protein